MKTLALATFSLLVATSTWARDILVFAATKIEDGASYQLVAGREEAKLVGIQEGGVVGDFGNGPEKSNSIMKIQVSPDVGVRIEKFSMHYGIQIVILRVLVEKNFYESYAVLSPKGFGLLHGDILYVPVPPIKKIEEK